MGIVSLSVLIMRKQSYSKRCTPRSITIVPSASLTGQASNPMAGYGGQGGYNQDFYESGYDMDGMQQQAPPHEQQGWQEQAPPVPAMHAPAPSQQWSGMDQQQQGYYHSGSYGAQQSYGEQGII